MLKHFLKCTLMLSSYERLSAMGYSSSSSSSSSSDDDRRAKKERKKKEKKRQKKEKKRQKKERKRDKKRKREEEEALEEADPAQLEAFRAAVQGPKRFEGPAAPAPSSALDASTAEQRAERLGLPKGLVRTSVRTHSISDGASKSLFGYGGSANPAQQARVKRERTAQKALATAKAVLAARAGAPEPDAPSAGTLSSRFDSGGFARR